jgi:hypothetical protein
MLEWKRVEARTTHPADGPVCDQSAARTMKPTPTARQILRECAAMERVLVNAEDLRTLRAKQDPHTRVVLAHAELRTRQAPRSGSSRPKGSG